MRDFTGCLDTHSKRNKNTSFANYMKTAKSKTAPTVRRFFSAPALLAIVLAILFWKSFLPGYVHFSNDGPLAQQNAAYLQLPGAFTGCWDDLNGIGINSGAFSPSITAGIRWILDSLGLGAVGFSKFFQPIALFILGLGAWTFFRQLKLSPLAAVLGGLAVMLNSTYFSNACWGVASQEIAVGMCYFALALVVSNSSETPPLIRWMRIAFAGLAVGINVMEGADNGAIFSLFIAAFVLFKALLEESRPVWLKLSSGIIRIVVIAVFAAFIAAQTIVALVGVAIVGVAGAQQTPEAKAKNWDFATQWSLPKVETFSLFVPGLFGYRMDTPKDASWLGESYRGGNYWGAVGRDPAWDRYFASDKQTPPDGNVHYIRFSGGGNYCGVLVMLIAFWALAQSFRRRDSVFTDSQRKFIWFWTVICIFTILLAWGRFAPFYQLFYMLPYSSTMRNPAKFISVFSWAFLILFAHGVHGLCRRYLEAPATNVKSSVAQLQSWWKNARSFDRKWTVGCGIAFAASVCAWIVYASEKPALVNYLQTVQFGRDMAEGIAAFSISQAGWFLLIFAVAILLCILVIAGIFSGKRARLGGILLGALLLVDLVRADLPWIVHWNYPVKYQNNPVVDFLREKPYEHRVIDLPFSAAPHLPQYDDYWEELYRIEWIQQLFPYYNVQSLDYVQNPRPPMDIVAFSEALAPNGTSDSLYLLARNWMLSNNRYFLGPTAIQLPGGNVNTLSFLNDGLDPEQKRFHVVQQFDIAPKEGVEQIHELEQFTAVTNDNGGCALFEFTGALPRAKLYSNWETNSPATLKGFSTNGLTARDLDVFNNVGTNDFFTLKKLASPSFDPRQTVLLSDPLPVPSAGTNQNYGTVEFKSYSPKKIVLSTQAATPTVLLLNDKYDPHWRVWVDGKSAPLFRANFIMRGVYLPAGPHTVEFYFTLPSRPLYISLTAIGVGILLSGLLIFLTRKPKTSDKK